MGIMKLYFRNAHIKKKNTVKHGYSEVPTGTVDFALL